MAELTYLACPYSHPDPVVRLERFRLVNKAAAKLMREGAFVFSPISHTHPIALNGLPTGWEFWGEFDSIFLGMATRFAVLCLDGWIESEGVRNETHLAREAGLVIYHLSPKEYCGD